MGIKFLETIKKNIKEVEKEHSNKKLKNVESLLWRCGWEKPFFLLVEFDEEWVVFSYRYVDGEDNFKDILTDFLKRAYYGNVCMAVKRPEITLKMPKKDVMKLSTLIGHYNYDWTEVK